MARLPILTGSANFADPNEEDFRREARLEEASMIATGDSSTTANVYACDTAIPESNQHATNVFLFAIEADAEPVVLARVANLFNLANVAPLSANLHKESIERVKILVEMESISAPTADLIRRKLTQLTCIISVELTVQNAMQKDVRV